MQAHASECYRGCGRTLDIPALSDQLAAVAVTMGERLGSDDAWCSTQIAESGRLRSASAMRATPCRSAGYGTGSGGVARIVRVKLPVSFRHSFAPASGGRGFALGFLGRHAANALRA